VPGPAPVKTDNTSSAFIPLQVKKPKGREHGGVLKKPPAPAHPHGGQASSATSALTGRNAISAGTYDSRSYDGIAILQKPRGKCWAIYKQNELHPFSAGFVSSINHAPVAGDRIGENAWKTPR